MTDFDKIENVFCVLPFTHLATHPDGGVTTCCESKCYAPDLNLNTDSVNKIRNNSLFEEVRQYMKSGKKHSSCNFCYKREEQGLRSKRQIENEKYDLNANSYKNFITNPLISVELRLGNTCNAKCLICHPHSSSKWNEDADVLGVDKVILNREWYKNSKVYDSIIEHSDNITHLWFNGGEPTLIKEHYYLLERLIEVGRNSYIELEYHTNGTNLPEKLLLLWKQFKFVKVTLSIDDTHDRLYYSRFPTSHDTVYNNIKTLEKNEIHFDIIPSISLYNIYNLDYVYHFFKNEFNKEIQLNFVRYPQTLTIGNLTDEMKEEVITKFTLNNLPEKFIKEIQYNFDVLPNIGLKKFLEYSKKLDIHRNLSILEYLPEWKIWNEKVV